MKKLIYRIEDNNGNGFYNSTSIYIDKKKHKFLFNLSRHPVTKYDSGIMRFPESKEKHGFINLDQLYKWLHSNELKFLLNKGFKLVRKYVTITAIGESQVLYIDEEQTKKESLEQLFINHCLADLAF